MKKQSDFRDLGMQTLVGNFETSNHIFKHHIQDYKQLVTTIPSMYYPLKWMGNKPRNVKLHFSLKYNRKAALGIRGLQCPQGGNRSLIRMRGRMFMSAKYLVCLYKEKRTGSSVNIREYFFELNLFIERQCPYK